MLNETELSILYRVSKYNSSKTRLIFSKLISKSTRKRLLNTDSEKPYNNYESETNKYINIYRKKSEIEHFRRLRVELKKKT